jgi:hypothetical protein
VLAGFLYKLVHMRFRCGVAQAGSDVQVKNLDFALGFWVTPLSLALSVCVY